jgi:hypothetical protein
MGWPPWRRSWSKRCHSAVDGCPLGLAVSCGLNRLQHRSCNDASQLSPVRAVQNARGSRSAKCQCWGGPGQAIKGAIRGWVARGQGA